MYFNFKYFRLKQSNSTLKVGTDAFVLGALIEKTETKRVLDIGAGTGVLALIAAQKFPAAHIEAVELDKESAELAGENFSNSPWAERLNIHCGKIQDFTSSNKFDLIISNPPYYENSYSSDKESVNRSKHNTGLTAFELMNSAAHLLNSVGEFWLILSVDFITSYLEAAKNIGLKLNKEIEVFGKPGVLKRKVLVFSHREEKSKELAKFTIRNKEGKYTAEYKALTAELHDREL